MKLKYLFSLWVVWFSLMCLGFAQVNRYHIDSASSSLLFKIRHFIGSAEGLFSEFSGDIWFDDADFKNNKVSATIKVESVDMDSRHRNKHLKSDEFFDIEKYPVMGFESVSWIKNNDSTITVYGDLVMKGIKHPVTLILKDVLVDANMFQCHASAVIDRSDWDFTHGMPILGKQVDVDMDVKARVVD